MATETRVSTIPGSWRQAYQQNFGGYQSVVNIVAASPWVSQITITRTSDRTPGFNGPNRPEPLKPLAFSFKKTTDSKWTGYNNVRPNPSLTPASYGYYARQYTGPGQDDGQTKVTPAVDQSRLLQVRAQLTNKLLSKVKNQSVNIGVMLGERKQTAKLFADTVTAVAGTIRSLKHGDIVGAANHLGVRVGRKAKRGFNGRFRGSQADAVASGWLQPQYGWKPMMADLYGACEQIAKKHSSSQFTTASVRTRYIQNLDQSVTSYNNGITKRFIAICKVQVDVKYQVRYSTPSQPLSLLQQLGVTNPLSVAWELVPFSFVADWFVPVGEFLGTLDATLGLQFHSGFYTVFAKGVGFNTLTESGVSGSDNTTLDKNLWCNLELVQVDRVILSDFPAPTLPRFKNPLSLGHGLNALALLKQLTRK